MPKFPNAHLVLNSRDRNLTGNSGTYNNFIVRNPGQNLVQGQMKDVALSEVYFPYDIPNIQAGFNTFDLFNGLGTLEISIVPGWYTGTELATAITTAMEDAGAAADADMGGPFAADEMPTCVYSEVANYFVLEPPTAGTQAWDVYSSFTFFLDTAGVVPTIGKDIFSIMGFQQVVGPGNIPTLYEGGPSYNSGSAPLTFTDYIDICSPTLCQYQYIRDGSTTNFPRRVDLICRLYIADETSTTFSQPPGQRPFVIHRQFKNQRVMKNTAANAINDVDIQLYDDCGQPLQTTYNPRNYQITFHIYEADDGRADSNIGYKF